MTVIQKAKPFLAWLNLVVYLFLSFGGFNELVFCHDTDGQVNFEKAINGICSDAWESRQLSHLKEGTKTITQQGCVDEPVRASITRLTNDFSLKADISQEAVLQHSEPFFGYGNRLSITTSGLLPKPPPVPPAIHRFLEPVVLII